MTKKYTIIEANKDREGSVTSLIFEPRGKMPVHTAKICRPYKDGKDQWQNGCTYSRRQLEDMLQLGERVLNRLKEIEAVEQTAGSEKRPTKAALKKAA